MFHFDSLASGLGVGYGAAALPLSGTGGIAGPFGGYAPCARRDAGAAAVTATRASDARLQVRPACMATPSPEMSAGHVIGEMTAAGGRRRRSSFGRTTSVRTGTHH